MGELAKAKAVEPAIDRGRRTERSTEFERLKGQLMMRQELADRAALESVAWLASKRKCLEHKPRLSGCRQPSLKADDQVSLPRC